MALQAGNGIPLSKAIFVSSFMGPPHNNPHILIMNVLMPNGEAIDFIELLPRRNGEQKNYRCIYLPAARVTRACALPLNIPVIKR
jgi:hypothetical protein